MVEIYINPEILALRALHSDLMTRGFRDSCIRDRLATQASTIVAAHKAGNGAVAFHLGSWCPGLVGVDSDKIMAVNLTQEQAQETIAREYGYTNWNEVEALQGILLDDEFEESVDAVIHGDMSQLQDRIRERPELTTQRSQYGHRATLLHYVGANGVESYRQITPLNAVEVTRCRVGSGADVNSIAGMYGGSKVLDLVLTSAHPHSAGVALAIAEVLRDAGAS